MIDYKKDICAKCGGEFEIIPPTDPEYCIPKEREPEDDDYEKRIYEDDNLHHQKTVYWIKKDLHVAGGPLSKSKKGLKNYYK